MTPKQAWSAIGAMFVVFLAVMSYTPEPPEAPRPGSAALYADLATRTSRADLQDIFDAYMTTVERSAYGTAARQEAFGYADAAIDRMKELRCP